MSTPAELLTRTPGGAARITSPAPREAWWQLSRQDADAHVSQTPTWLDCLCGTGPYRDASRLYEFDSGSRIVVPLVRRRSGAAWLDAEESWPADWGIGGPLSSGAVAPAEARAVFEDLARLAALRVGVRFRPEGSDVWEGTVPAGFWREPHMTQRLDLDGGFATVWERRFHRHVRREVRKAERSKAEVDVDRTGRLVPQFYSLYEQSIERWAAQQHEPLALARWRRRRAFPRNRLEAVAARFGESCTIWMASCDGEPAAAIVVLSHGGHARLWRAAMNRDLAHPLRVNPLLQKLAIEDACAAGYRHYDMGESSPGSSLASFKAGFGAESHSSPRYVRERLPVSAAQRNLRRFVKTVLRFQDA
ncbi:GNAT family N-acetyltransferase [Streptomyces sp. NPDC052682]|uniref:GNAT family N-acetyltransferase n=1 Tax=Streptomyces sp. NPDC052682 TaxID=3154954 RepID=UPI003424B383